MVTKYRSEIYFVSSTRQGEIIEMGMEVVEFGPISLILHCEVRNKLTHKRILKIDKIVLLNVNQKWEANSTRQNRSYLQILLI